jgi:hypothetical protein
MTETENNQVKDQPLEQRLEWFEQHLKVARERVAGIDLTCHELTHEVGQLVTRVRTLESKMRQLIPEVENCPKCHRKVNPGARSCPMCSHAW